MLTTTPIIVEVSFPSRTVPLIVPAEALKHTARKASKTVNRIIISEFAAKLPAAIPDLDRCCVMKSLPHHERNINSHKLSTQYRWAFWVWRSWHYPIIFSRTTSSLSITLPNKETVRLYGEQ